MSRLRGLRLATPLSGAMALDRPMQGPLDARGDALRLLRLRLQAGYTLIEVVIVLVVLGILAGVAVGSIAGSRDAAEVRRTQDALVGDLRVARMRAMGCSAGEVTLAWDAEGWGVEAPACGQPIQGAGWPEGVEVVPGESSVTFTYPWGSLEGDEPVTLEITGGSGVCRAVRIEPNSGRARRVQEGACGGG